ncbi:GtrA family protein [Christensenellaceae bacterium OttesenSCG-928-L17]|nr:GtrA family protein [Christensenellaceae bacterium OttesenSCG-928-L17]
MIDGVVAKAVKHAQKLRFGAVGVANTLIDMGMFAIFANVAKIGAEAASVMSTSVAIVFSFFANYYYVWRSKKSKKQTIPQFLAVTLATAWGVQTGVIWVVKLFVGDGDIENLFAKVCAIGIGMVVNYLLYKIIFLGKDRNDKK